MTESKTVSKIYLSERWTKVVNALPRDFWASSQHPNLLVEPSGFRRVVLVSLDECEMFLETLTKIETAIEDRIPGITSYYTATRKGEDRGGYYTATSGSSVLTVRAAISGDVAISGAIPGTHRYGSTALPASVATTPAPSSAPAIIEKIGDTYLYNNRKIDPDEKISLEKGLDILSRVQSLRDATLSCLATFGALDQVLGVGKIFHQDNEIVYFGERALQTQGKQCELIPLQTYWGSLSTVNRMKAVQKKLATLLS